MEGHVSRASAWCRARQGQVGDYSRTLGVGVQVVRIPAVVAILRPGGGGADSRTVTLPDEQPAVADAVHDISLAVAVEVAHGRGTDRPAAGELGPSGRRKRSEARFGPDCVERVKIGVGAAVQQLLQPVAVDVCGRWRAQELEVVHLAWEGRYLRARATELPNGEVIV